MNSPLSVIILKVLSALAVMGIIVTGLLSAFYFNELITFKRAVDRIVLQGIASEESALSQLRKEGNHDSQFKDIFSLVLNDHTEAEPKSDSTDATNPLVVSMKLTQARLASVMSLRTTASLCAVFVLLFVGFLAAYWKASLAAQINILVKKVNGVEAGVALDGTTVSLSSFGGKVEMLVNRQVRAYALVDQVVKGEFDAAFVPAKDDRFDEALIGMRDKVKELAEKERVNSWVSDNMSALEKLLKTEEDTDIRWKKAIALLAKSISAPVGILYALQTSESETYFNVIGNFGLQANACEKIPLGAGQVGEVGIKKQTKVFNNLPATYLRIESGLGTARSSSLVIVPLIFNDTVYGAFELGSFQSVLPEHQQLLEHMAESIAAHLFNLKIHAETKLALENLTKKQSEELVHIHALQQQTHRSLEQQLEEVRDEKLKNEAILDGCVDAVVCFDEGGTIHFCNNAMSEMCGLPKDAIVQTSIKSFLDVQIRQNRIVYNKTQKSIEVRTEATLTGSGGSNDVLVTASCVSFHDRPLFTCFIQEIAIDLF